MKRARTWGWAKTPRYDGTSSDLGPSSPHQSCSGCIIATRGYDFREGQDNVIARAPQNRQGVRVKVPNDERVANDIGPESCAAAREGRREALTGVRSGWPLSRESKLQSAGAVSKAEGNMDGGARASLPPGLRGLRPQR